MTTQSANAPTLRPHQEDRAPYRKDHDARWSEARQRLLAAVASVQRAEVARRLQQAPHGGLGLRLWLRTLVTQGRPLPEALPAELVQVYLEDPDAVPAHDCAICGVAIPVQPGWQGYDDEPRRVYFPTCPCCGGRTGLYAYWSSPAQA